MTRFAVRKLDQTGITPLGNLVKADVHHVIAEGNQVLAAAEEQGRRAYRAAVEQGRKQGEAQGQEASAATMADTLAAAQSYLHKSEKRLIAMVVEAVSRIIGEFDRDDLTARIVRQLLREAKDEGKIRLRVSPGQFQVIEEHVRGMQSEAKDVKFIEVVADAAIEEGACRMETEIGFANTSANAQLEILRTALKKHPVE